MIIIDKKDDELVITGIETVELKKLLKEEILQSYNFFMGFKQ